jgi:hypothetical protein
MTYHPSMLRPSLAAIAAALALSATPAFAQTDPAPVTIAPPPPTIAPAAPATSTTASEAPANDQTSDMSAPIDTPPTVAPVATQSPVVVHTAPDRAVSAPAVRTPVATKAAPVTVAKTAPAAASEAPRPVASAPVLRAPLPVASPARAQTRVRASTTTDETALYAGLGGAAVLILGGAALALGRRKHRDDEVGSNDYSADDAIIADPIVAAEPSYDTAPAAVASVAARRELVDQHLANGFDLSRFGPHTRAAYRGPTEDNPSLSLKKRLKIASFRDGRLREAAQADGPAAEPLVDRSEVRTDRKLFGSRLSDRLSFRPGPRTGFRPAIA